MTLDFTSFLSWNGRYYAEKSRQQEQSLAAARGGRGGRSKPAARQGGVYNHGLDDENFDYIVHEGEIFHGRYAVRETIGKGVIRRLVVVLHTR